MTSVVQKQVPWKDFIEHLKEFMASLHKEYASRVGRMDFRTFLTIPTKKDMCLKMLSAVDMIPPYCP